MKRTKTGSRFLAVFLGAGIILGNSAGTVLAEETNAVGGRVLTENVQVELNRQGGMATAHYTSDAVSILNDSAENQIIQRLTAALENGTNTIDVSDLGLMYTIEEDVRTISSAVSNLLNSNYRYFYLSGKFSFSYGGGTNIIRSITVKYLPEYMNEDGSLNQEKVQAKQAELENAVNEALDCVESEMEDVEKILAVHDYLVSVCDYDYENYLAGTIPDASYSIEGVLLDGVAVCQGYAETFCTLMQELGIDSYLVSSSSMNHAWNLVALNGNWYHVDCTWDDPVFGSLTYYGKANNDYADEGFVNHRYFLKSDAEFQNLEHEGWSSDLPAASKSNAYSGYCFYDVPQKMNYYNSYWYYRSMESNKLSKAKINETAYSNSIQLQHNAYYVHELNDKLYFSTGSQVYQYDLSNGTENLYCDVAQTYPGYTITEFAIKHQQLIAVIYNNETSDFQRVILNSDDISVSGVSLNKKSLTLTSQGATEQLTATVAPGNATNKGVTWSSSNPEVATVSNSGLVKAVSNGTSTITVTTEDGNKKATCEVTVSYPVTISVTGVTLNKTSTTLTSKGATEQLTAAVLPDNATNKGVTWSSSNPEVATVSNSGLVKAVSNGTSTITVTTEDGNKKATCEVTVSYPVTVNVTGVSLNKTSTTLRSQGATEQLTATVTPGNATNKGVTWSSSNPEVATVSNSGLVKAVSNGTSTITVTTEDGNKKATCEVTVSYPVTISVTGVTLNKTSTTLTSKGATEQLTAAVLPDNATNKGVTWSSSNPEVATVSNSGLVKAVSNGTSTITVTTEDGNKKATCEVTVSYPVTISVTGVTLNKTSTTLTSKGATEQLTAAVLPDNATNKGVTWSSSNPEVATVSNSGLVKAVSNGTSTITVTTEDGNKKATCEVTVSYPVTVSVTGVSLNKTSLTLTSQGATEQLTATVAPDNATNKGVTWSSSNPEVATVSNSGLVKAVSNGTSTITVTTEDGNKKATCEVTVSYPVTVSVTGVSLNKTSTTLRSQGATEQLTATVEPGNATNKGVTWSSSNPSVATVSNSGLVKAVSNGTSTIMVTTEDGNKKATCEVTVEIEEKDTYTGLRNENGVWVYYVNGQVDTTKNGLIQYDGAWFFLKDGIMDTTMTGFVDYNGGTFYVAKGRLVKEYSGLAEGKDGWYYVAAGQVQKQYSGLAQYNGAWFLLANGKVNKAYKGLYTYDGAQFLVADGQILSSYNGLFQYQGKWYYIAGGQVSKYTGLALYDGAWFYIVSGILAEDYTGWVWYDGSQFYVVSGMVRP